MRTLLGGDTRPRLCGKRAFASALLRLQLDDLGANRIEQTLSTVKFALDSRASPLQLGDERPLGLKRFLQPLTAIAQPLA